jgi:hypothetical protein
MTKQIILALCLITLGRAQAEVRVPAFTAYLDPDADGAEVSARSGISGWTDPALRVLWFGEIKTPGKVTCLLELRLARKASCAWLRLANRMRPPPAEWATIW